MCDAARDKERSTVGTMEEDGMAGRGWGVEGRVSQQVMKALRRLRME